MNPFGARGGHGSHFFHVRRWGDKLPLLYREVPNASHGSNVAYFVSRAWLPERGVFAFWIIINEYDHAELGYVDELLEIARGVAGLGCILPDRPQSVV